MCVSSCVYVSVVKCSILDLIGPAGLLHPAVFQLFAALNQLSMALCYHLKVICTLTWTMSNGDDKSWIDLLFCQLILGCVLVVDDWYWFWILLTICLKFYYSNIILIFFVIFLIILDILIERRGVFYLFLADISRIDTSSICKLTWSMVIIISWIE